MRRAPILLAVTVLLAAAATAVADQATLENPAVLEILAMVEADMSEEVIMARLDKAGAFPILDGHDLAGLKRLGVSETVLLRMVELGSNAPPEPVAEEPEAAAADGGSVLRVVVERPFAVHYYEVVVDGDIVATDGALWEGSAGGGETPKRPTAVRSDRRFVAFETDAETGTHAVSVGFAVSTAEGEPDDEWAEYAGEEYRTRGIRATGDALPGGSESGNLGTMCEVVPGGVCEVIATLSRTAPTSLGGLPTYGVEYTVKIAEAGDPSS